MRKILLVGHGNFASGLYSAAKFFTENKNQLSYIDAYANGENLDSKLEEYFAEVDSEDSVIMLTDLIAGMTTQKCFTYVNDTNIYLIAGTNLPIVIKLLASNQKIQSIDEITDILEQASQGISIIDSSSINFDDFDE